ncbi:MAG TPA: DUF2188 domain-containing protein [Acidimicrobiia bacterium]|nr:DUF2188 domain-containing protein [Acidimicrobiia bacterium]
MYIGFPVVDDGKAKARATGRESEGKDAMAKEQLHRVEVRPLETGWVAREKDGSTIAEGREKAIVVKKAAAKLRKRGEPASLRIHGRNGRFQEERTYPRASGPRRRRG